MDLFYTITDTKYIDIKEIIKSKLHISDRLYRKLKSHHQIFINDSPINYCNSNLQIGDIISVDLNFIEKSENILPVKMNLDILYEDDYLLIINKNSNTPVHPSCNHFNDSLSNGVQYYFNSIDLKRKIRIVNRLDKDTSGIVIFAKNEYIQECLIKQMKLNTFKKEYLAILTGILNEKKGTLSFPIARKTNSIIERCIDFSIGQVAITHFDVIKEFDSSYSLVHFELDTGRTHQIRVHSAYIGHPILGDSLYGNHSDKISRQALHSYKVSFYHPITNEKICITSEPPSDFNII
jgi:23S rRNA pseudouridine1911/1915/1917 synthase